MSHRNARTTFHGRMLIVERFGDGWPKARISPRDEDLTQVPDNDQRVSGETVDTKFGRYTVRLPALCDQPRVESRGPQDRQACPRTWF
jgi:hypothetical protein